MARPRATAEQRQHQRARIRRAAADIYRDGGLPGITARAVSERAGVSTGTLYSYFANLEELMQSLWGEPVAAMNQELENLVMEHSDPVARIRALLEAYVQFALDQPEVFRSAVLFVRPASSPKPDVAPAEELPFYRLLVGAVAEAQSVDRIGPGGSSSVAQVLWAGIHGALALPINIDRFAVQPQTELAPNMIESLMASIIVNPGIPA